MIIYNRAGNAALNFEFKTEDSHNESKSYISMHRVQAEKLQYHEKQEERP